MAGSTVVAVKSALTDVLRGRPALSGVQVFYGEPLETSRSERIVIGDVEGADHEPVALRSGRRRREETYDVKVACHAVGPTQQAADTRAVALFREVEEAVADDPTLGLQPDEVAFVVVSGFDLTSYLTPDNRYGAVIDARITVKARLL